ncbi:hypothetical protein AKJ64_03730 [candidate division MSBL1 archaeon SCGC-AAA259E17]|uniref:MPN domain-containing protein n=1 Tax=candidate division MSBL1 archaeon SCGC-AAA259E17 TaxID=1698263 RepID=A0A133UDF4_9EURY|nr:hypothetical protein AKJ64_03730 [candidate division MSBL1 archaeon SCGC-AAA259E17]
MSIREIDEKTLDFILEASKSAHPNEFVGILRSEKNKITEILVLPGTHTSEQSAFMNIYMLPILSHACGSVHSHPSSNPNPSQNDLTFFDKFGEIHIITANPYDGDSWKAFNRRGKEVKLKVFRPEKNPTSEDEPWKKFWD